MNQIGDFFHQCTRMNPNEIFKVKDQPNLTILLYNMNQMALVNFHFINALKSDMLKVIRSFLQL